MSQNHSPDPMLLRAAAAEQQQQLRERQIAALHRATSQEIYSHLAAVVFHRTMAAEAKKADPLGLQENVEIEAPAFDLGELMNAAKYSQFAAMVFLVAVGEVRPEALEQFRRKG